MLCFVLACVFVVVIFDDGEHSRILLILFGLVLLSLCKWSFIMTDWINVVGKIWSSLYEIYGTPSGNKDPKRVAIILSANGSISNPRFLTSIGSEVYKGTYDIVQLSGNFYVPQHSPTQLVGSMRLTMNYFNGAIFGGIVVGEMLAADFVQVVISSFIRD
ncbi:hypothetical protein Leryth_025697 [Lithospermum erythrorhizon]|nr:hypothetical protein Leryth_025697 [Lithospermum erythrorhizon]